MVFERNVADYAETYEGSIVKVASLGDRAALHVDSLGIGEVVKYRLHLLTSIDKPVAAYYKTAAHMSATTERCSLIDQFGRTAKACRLTHHLTHLALVATVNIVIAALGTNHNIGDIERSVGSASHACRNDKIGTVTAYHLHSANGRIDLADAALLHHHLIVADTALDKCATVVCLDGLVCGKSLQLCKLLVHSHYYSYSHCYCSVIFVSEMQSYSFLPMPQ